MSPNKASLSPSPSIVNFRASSPTLIQMGEAPQLHVIMDEGSNAVDVGGGSRPLRRRSFNKWLILTGYAFLVIAGQSVATLLGRLYFDKGGKSKWLETVIQLGGFPILLPFYFIPSSTTKPTATITTVPPPPPPPPPSTLILASVYVSLGLLVALVCFLFSVGLDYLPSSTFSLIGSSQLAFNALLSFFLNSQKFTCYIVNALVLLTISSTLLIFRSGDAEENPTGSSTKYAIGFICTLAASAGYGLMLSLTQLAFRRVVRRDTFRAVMDMIVFQNLVAALATMVGLFASGEWKDLGKEMEEYESGTVSYFMNLAWTTISWQLFSLGSVGMIMEASSLFSNAISVLGLPVVPVIAVIFFHDKMDGVKAMAMVLAIWGFVSYAYDHYLEDHQRLKTRDINANGEVSNNKD